MQVFLLVLCLWGGSQGEDGLFLYRYPVNPQFFSESALQSMFPQGKILVDAPRMKDMPNTGLVHLHGFKPSDVDVAKPIVHDAATHVESEQTLPLKSLSTENDSPISVVPDETAAPNPSESSAEIKEEDRAASSETSRDKAMAFTSQVNADADLLDKMDSDLDKALEEEEIEDEKKEIDEMNEETHVETKSFDRLHGNALSAKLHPAQSASSVSSDHPIGVRNPHAKLISLTAVAEKKAPIRSFSRASRTNSFEVRPGDDENFESVHAKAPHVSTVQSSAKVNKGKMVDFDPWNNEQRKA